jgi:hypothetical protein
MSRLPSRSLPILSKTICEARQRRCARDTRLLLSEAGSPQSKVKLPLLLSTYLGAGVQPKGLPDCFGLDLKPSTAWRSLD